VETTELARVIALLDEIKEEAEGLQRRTGFHAAIIIHTKATEAQNILVGAEPTSAEDN
jgi:hypothetical protein